MTRDRTSPLDAWRVAWRRIDAVRLILIPCLTGVLTGGAAIAFVELLRLVQWMCIGSADRALPAVSSLPWYRVVWVPALGGLLVGPLLRYLAPEAEGHGVPEVIEAVLLRRGRIRRRVAMVKSIASALTIGTGGSVGREGPIVQIGAAIGSAIGQGARLSVEHVGTLAACGSAAGLAAVFNAPIAGAFFSLEVITGNFAMPSFGPVILASVLGTVVSRAYFGDHPAFIVQPYELQSIWEMPVYALLGVACGVVGALFTSVLGALETHAHRLPIARIWRPAAGGLLLGVLICGVPDLYGVGYGTMDAVLRGETAWTWLALLLPLKIFATSLTLASGGSGGVFIPSLYIGAVAGGLFGSGAHALLPAATAGTGAYALVGTAGVLSAATHSPITAMILLFEMSGDYKIILPVMIVVTLATAVSRALVQDSIYTAPLRRRGIVLQRREDIVMRSHTVGEAMRPAESTVRDSQPIVEVMERFARGEVAALYVVDDQEHLVGVVSIRDILGADLGALGSLVIAGDVAERHPIEVAAGETLAQCMEHFLLSERDDLPVVSADGKLLGVISRRDVLAVYNRELLRREYLSARDDGDADRRGSVRLDRGLTIARLPAPASLAGHSLREADLRAREGLTVVAVQRAGESHDQMPDPDQPLAEGDVLVVVGTAESLAAFAAKGAGRTED